jgi:hypothetical protein
MEMFLEFGCVGSANAAYVGGFVADARGDQLELIHMHEQPPAIHPEIRLV